MWNSVTLTVWSPCVEATKRPHELTASAMVDLVLGGSETYALLAPATARRSAWQRSAACPPGGRRPRRWRSNSRPGSPPRDVAGRLRGLLLLLLLLLGEPPSVSGMTAVRLRLRPADPASGLAVVSILCVGGCWGWAESLAIYPLPAYRSRLKISSESDAPAGLECAHPSSADRRRLQLLPEATCTSAIGGV